MLREACCGVERRTESGAITSMWGKEISRVMILELGLERGVGIEQLDWGSWSNHCIVRKPQYESRQGADSVAVVMVGAQGEPDRAERIITAVVSNALPPM